jgi:hypothetical protein
METIHGSKIICWMILSIAASRFTYRGRIRKARVVIPLPISCTGLWTHTKLGPKTRNGQTFLRSWTSSSRRARSAEMIVVLPDGDNKFGVSAYTNSVTMGKQN